MTTECERYGLLAPEVTRRLEAFGLGPEADDHVLRLHVAMEPHLDAAIDDFYAHLGAQPALAGLLQDTDRIARLKVTQRAHLQTLGIGRHSSEYFERRLRVGRAHERVGLAPTHYLAAYAALVDIVAARLRRALPAEEVVALVSTLTRLIMLDADLALTTYHGERFETIVERVRHDPLTGLASRAALMERLVVESERAQRFTRSFAVVFIDLDGFKAINDHEGHAAGDAVLAQVGLCIRESVRPADVAGRYGGDEFVLGLVEADAPTAVNVATRILQRLEAGQPRPLPSASVGVAVMRSNEDVPLLLARADAAMYRAKQSGKSRVCVDDEG